MAGKAGSQDVDGVDVLVEHTHQRHEVFELRPQGVQEHNCPASTSSQETQLAPESRFDTLRIHAGSFNRSAMHASICSRSEGVMQNIAKWAHKLWTTRNVLFGISRYLPAGSAGHKTT